MLAQIQNEQLSPAEAKKQGSPFMLGHRFTAQSATELGRHLGKAFVHELEASDIKPGHWYGPIQSTFGLHLVWVQAIVEARDAELHEVRDTIEYNLGRKKQQEALHLAIAKLREQYEVRL